jgi:pyruvate,water dikinase
VAGFSEQELDALPDRELWETFLAWVGRFQHAISLQVEITNLGMVAFSLLEGLATRWLGRKELARTLITGLSGVYAAGINPALWELARALEQAGLAETVHSREPADALAALRSRPEARPALELLESFLGEFGHRCPGEGEWLRPRWAEAPEQVLALVAGYLRAGEQAVSPGEVEAAQRRSREQAEAQAAARLDPLRRAIFRGVLRRAQHGVRLRDNGKHYYMKLALPIRRIDLAFGRRWAARGWLAQPEDIFFLTIPDLERVIQAGDPGAAGLELLPLVAGRRQAYAYWSQVQSIPPLLGSDGRPLDGGAEGLERSGVLRGIPASGGRARGVARLVRDPRQALALGRGDILVTRAADPGWTPVFALVGGLVLEVGGQLSHAAIVARECGLPAVVNVPGATQLIQDGQVIMVDGSQGNVYLTG